MSVADRKYHETWLGMVQPIEGLVFSIPVLVDAQATERRPAAFQQSLLDHLDGAGTDEDVPVRVRDLEAFFAELLELTPDLFHRGDELPDDLSVYVEEGKQTLRPTWALQKLDLAASSEEADVPPSAQAGRAYEALVLDIPAGLPLDKPETQTGDWSYPPVWKLDRLLRATRVPIGLLTNHEVIALVYAPHGESTGVLTFRLADMATVGGRPILDAFATLLSAQRFFGVSPDRTLPAILKESRQRQANVTETLAEQVFEALQLLLDGFEEAERRDDTGALRAALEHEENGDHVYGGLLTVLLRLVFLLYAEERNLLPTDAPLFREHLSLLGLYEQLAEDHDAYLESMTRRFGAWPRLLALFRAVFDGVEAPGVSMPARRGVLFDPAQYPFLEGGIPGAGVPIGRPEEQAEMRVPSIDDRTVFLALQKLIFLDGQRLSYRALDVEQIGSVYEALMGFHVLRATSQGLPIRGQKKTTVWIFADEVLGEKPNRRDALVKDAANLAKGKLTKPIKEALSAAESEDDVLEALAPLASKKAAACSPGRLVLQPGKERRRTSSHYTPPSLTEPIVRRTLEPLIAAMGGTPSSEQVLNLKVCDPAMGSGAFLVAACRYLGDQVVAAWTREGQLDRIAGIQDPVMAARRLVAQRCLYGVDKNPFAVNLAKLSLWLETLAVGQPFTFVDHALRHGDSLVGLSLEQIRSFHWKPDKQMDWCARALSAELDEAIADRQRILDLAGDDSPANTKEKELALRDAEDALSRARLLADLVVGAFFSADKTKAREAERRRRLTQAQEWIESGDEPSPELMEMRHELRGRLPTFHWELEFPEFFDGNRSPQELDENGFRLRSFIGNPPYMFGGDLNREITPNYSNWLVESFENYHGTSDLCVGFLRRATTLVGEAGTMGLVLTRSVAQAENRESGLGRILEHRTTRIVAADTGLEWEGGASVSFVTVVLAIGTRIPPSTPLLDGEAVDSLNSYLRRGREHPEPGELQSNLGLSSQGYDPRGAGFILEAADMRRLAENSTEQEFISMYLTGQDLNRSPDHTSNRYAIDFSGLELEEVAELAPNLLEHVKEQVLPVRLRLPSSGINDRLKKYWWRFWADRPEFRKRIKGLERCIAVAAVSPHAAFALIPSSACFSKQLIVFASESWELWAILQSRIHEVWALLRSGSMRNDLRYSISKCFNTFPLPLAAPSLMPQLSSAAAALYETRAAAMLEMNQGLTSLYNDLKNPANCEPHTLLLREQHESVERAVLNVYGWNDLTVPPYCPCTPQEQRDVEAFEDQVLERLFDLNEQRLATDETREARMHRFHQSGDCLAREQSGARDAYSEHR